MNWILYLIIFWYLINFRLESNGDAEVSDLKARKKQLEDAVQPIIAKLYAGTGGPQPGAETESEKDEL